MNALRAIEILKSMREVEARQQDLSRVVGGSTDPVLARRIAALDLAIEALS